MYVCLCEGVTDRTVHKAIARGARTVDEIAVACGAGSGCGGCWHELQELLHESLPRVAAGVGAGGHTANS